MTRSGLSAEALDWLRARHVDGGLPLLMLETIIAARQLGVDPFDQPAVEEGKVLAKRYFRNGGRPGLRQFCGEMIDKTITCTLSAQAGGR